MSQGGGQKMLVHNSAQTLFLINNSFGLGSR